MITSSLEFVLFLGITILAMCAAYIAGLLQGGIKIYKDQNTNISDKQEYNSSYLEEVPSEMKQYVEQHQGQFK